MLGILGAQGSRHLFNGQHFVVRLALCFSLNQIARNESICANHLRQESCPK
jgi:hypothetical protein